ncbi:MAG: hypothetical protein UHS47_08525 [Oscillospiraceae bacterium]|nr:hypothetical protein [Oscillospiraceae bacterium]
MARRKQQDVTENPLYHDTWKLLQKYRDVVWSMELSVQQVKISFEKEFGQTIDDFLDSIYSAGADLSGTEIEQHARCIQRSNQMIRLVDGALDILRNKHQNGEELYWILYYTFIIPQKLQNTQQVIDKLRPHIREISYRTYFRKRREAIDALGSILWGYSAKETLNILSSFFPNPTS